MKIIRILAVLIILLLFPIIAFCKYIVGKWQNRVETAQFFPNGTAEILPRPKNEFEAKLFARGSLAITTWEKTGENNYMIKMVNFGVMNKASASVEGDKLILTTEQGKKITYQREK